MDEYAKIDTSAYLIVHIPTSCIYVYRQDMITWMDMQRLIMQEKPALDYQRYCMYVIRRLHPPLTYPTTYLYTYLSPSPHSRYLHTYIDLLIVPSSRMYQS